MIRSSIDIVQDRARHRRILQQRLWAELTGDAGYRIGEPIPECSVIEVKVTRDLSNPSEPYIRDLGIEVAFVLDLESRVPRDPQVTILDDGPRTMFDDHWDRPTSVETPRKSSPIPDALLNELAERIHVDLVTIQVKSGQTDWRELIVMPSVHLPDRPGAQWLLEIKFAEFETFRHILPLELRET